MKLHTYLMSPNPYEVRIVEIDYTPKRLFLEWHDTQVETNDVSPFEPSRNNPPVSPTRNEPSIDNADMETDNAIDIETEIEHGSDDSSSGDDSDSRDGDFLMDEDNIIDDVEVEMREFHLNVDPDVEWIKGASKRKHHVVTDDGNELDIEVINNELFLFESSSNDWIEGERKKIKAIRREFKDRVNQHAIEIRRELDFEKNDKNRVTVVFKGTITSLGGGTGQEVVYEEEVQTQNPVTTIKLDVESEPNPDVETTTFRRMYMCLGSLKQGFVAGKREFLRLDGAFMKGPFHG
ncbi:unnamed protein product [Lactuca saligna]|uniref:Uncharacterized protein n=1 Tax=Lactuca saligna TaxID=75948 RepID=A0AA35ZEP2_LACSI|nr:unnamed protein product [Lactuca saligna]